jgi:hypothetical protein
VCLVVLLVFLGFCYELEAFASPINMFDMLAMLAMSAFLKCFDVLLKKVGFPSVLLLFMIK